eukprot:UN12747
MWLLLSLHQIILLFYIGILFQEQIEGTISGSRACNMGNSKTYDDSWSCDLLSLFKRRKHLCNSSITESTFRCIYAWHLGIRCARC